MTKKTSKFTIKEKELAEALEISFTKLEKVIKFFDSDPDDEWELREHSHFIYENKARKIRIFSTQGAFAIAKYLDTHQKKSIWDKIKEFVTRHREKIRNAFVQRTVFENSSSLVLRNNHYFLSKKDTVAILGTSYARLNKAFKDLQRTEQSFQICVDFDDIEGVRYYSLSGLYRLSRNLSQELSDTDRRAWCKAVDVAGKQTFKAIADSKERRHRKIQKAKDRAKERDNSTCQITLIQQTNQNYEQVRLASHHIFSSHHYPHLAAVTDNLITLTEAVHNEFHRWNGGNQKACTVDNLILFVCERYPSNSKIVEHLYEIKSIFSRESSSVQLQSTSTRQLPPQDKAA